MAYATLALMLQTDSGVNVTAARCGKWEAGSLTAVAGSARWGKAALLVMQ
jgi:hypothetical protein